MFIEPSLAPTAIAIWCPSPVFGHGVTGLTSYPMNVLTISGFQSKPPQASTTPRRAPIRRGPSGPLDDHADHRARVVGDQLDRGGGRAHLAAGVDQRP